MFVGDYIKLNSLWNLLKNAGCLASCEMEFRKIKSQKCIPSPPQQKDYSDKKIPLPMLIFSPILSNLHAKGPLGNCLLGHRSPGPEDLFYSYSFPTGCSQVMLEVVRYLHSFTVSPLAFKVMEYFLSWKQMKRWQDSNLCIYKKKDSLCLLLMLSNPQVGKKLLLGFQGIQVIEMLLFCPA